MQLICIKYNPICEDGYGFLPHPEEGEHVTATKNWSDNYISLKEYPPIGGSQFIYNRKDFVTPEELKESTWISISKGQESQKKRKKVKSLKLMEHSK